MSSRIRFLGILVLITILAMVFAACTTSSPTSTKPASTAPATTSAPPATSKAPAASSAPATTSAPPATTTSPAAAQLTPAQFYSKNVLTVFTSSAGGSSDLLSRLIAAYWSQKVEGGLAKVVNNFGGSSRTSLSEMQKAKPDGLSLQVGGEFEASVLLGDPAAKYDPTSFIMLAAVGRTPSCLLLSIKSPYKTIDELKGASGFIFGSTGLMTEDSIGAVLVSSMLGLKDAKLITGYTGTAEVGLALARGEVGATVGGAATSLDHITKGFANPKIGMVFNATRSPWYPDTVPLAAEVTKLTAEQQSTLDLLIALQTMNKVMTSPGVPQDRVDFLRDVMMNKILPDKNFLAQVGLRWPIWEKPVSGPEYQEQCKKIMSISKNSIDSVKAVINKMGGIK